jgi:hypothetical protein
LNTSKSHRLRATIAQIAVDEPELTPGAIATRIGCSASTVYRFLRTPGSDGRTRNVVRPRLTHPRVIDNLRSLLRDEPLISTTNAHACLLDHAGRDASFPPVPSLRTVHRLLAELRQQLPSEPRDSEEIEGDGSSDAAAPPAPELPELTPKSSVGGVLRALLNSTIADLNNPLFRSPATRFRLRQQAAMIAITLARADRLNPPINTERSELARRLERVTKALREGTADTTWWPSNGVAKTHRDSPM